MIKNYEQLFEATPIHLHVMSIFGQLLPPSKTFVETGCHVGNSLMHAIHCGYTNLYSCDVDPSSVNYTIERVQPHCDNFKIEHVDSINFFKEILPNLDQKVTFWLDAHSGSDVPTWEELSLIKTLCPTKDHNIVIDDIPLYFGGRETELENAILDINKNYKITYEDIHQDGRDYVLVAKLK